MVLISEATSQAVLLELTVAWEERINKAFGRKRAKYEGLAGECRRRGWKTWCNPIKVSCRGFGGQLLIRALKLLGIKGLHSRRAIRKITEAA